MLLGSDSCRHAMHRNAELTRIRWKSSFIPKKSSFIPKLTSTIVFKHLTNQDNQLMNLMILERRSRRDGWVRVEPLHIHSGIGNLVTSLPDLPILSSGCPIDSLCNSLTILLNSTSGRDEFRKYGSMCRLFGVMFFLCPA